jgi:hypothetical protein
VAKLLEMKEILIRRKAEIALLEKVKDAQKSTFVAVYGRRRVGKPFLIRKMLLVWWCQWYPIFLQF